MYMFAYMHVYMYIEALTTIPPIDLTEGFNFWIMKKQATST